MSAADFMHGIELEAVKLYVDSEAKIDLAITVSVAISLKRIADLLDGTTLGLNVAETIFNPATIQNRDVRNHY